MSSLKKWMLSLATVATSALLVAPSALAQEGGAEQAPEVLKWKAVAAALCIALAAFGGALGQGRAAAAALDGIARNPGAQPKVFVPMLLGLALIESLVIYALIIAFLLLP